MPILSSMKSISLPKMSFGAGERLASAKFVDWLTSPIGVSKIVNACSIVASAYLCVLAGEELLKAELFKPPVIEITSGSGTDNGGKQSKSLETYQIITTRNLFGSTAPAPVATPAVANVPKPKLRLVGTNALRGTGAFAIIEDQNKNEQDVFNVSEQVFTYGKLIEINNESVKLEYPDRVDVLEIEEGKSAQPGSPLGEEPAPSNDQTDFTVSEGELNDALSNLPLLLSQARAVPYFRNGQSIGMRLFAIRSGSQYEKLGLQNGDIITSVNETSLSDPTQALRIFEQLKNERNIGVKMERNGLQRDSRYSIR
jgi:type II secretion system protein C